MRLRTRVALGVAVPVLLAGVRVWALTQDSLTNSTVDGGGGRSAGADFVLLGTAGQPDAGVSGSGPGGLEVRGGFWSGASDVTVDVDAPAGVRRHELDTPSPNPFNPRTTLRFVLARQTHVRLLVHDARGRVVRTLVDEVRPAGSHSLSWDGLAADGNVVASGVYHLRLIADDQVLTQKMTLIK